MSRQLVDKMIEAGLDRRVITTEDIGALIPDASRNTIYGRVHRAIDNGELVRLRSGAYVLSDRYRSPDMSLYAMGCELEPMSYVSLHSALSFHGLIPEQVKVVMLAVSRSWKRQRVNIVGSDIGGFVYQPLNAAHWMTDVQRRGDPPYLMAGPVRALADYVATQMRGKEWPSVESVFDDLRIEEPEALFNLEKIHAVGQCYPHDRRVRALLGELEYLANRHAGDTTTPKKGAMRQ